MRDTIMPGELHEMMERGDPVTILDVRKETYEHRQILGAHRYAGRQLENHESLPFGHDQNIVVYCTSGNSSRRIAESLRTRGLHAAALDGGFEAWAVMGLPTEPLGERINLNE